MTLAAWPTYDSYKDSGVEWIGAVPHNWRLKRLKHMTRQISDKVSSKDSSLRYIGMENVESWSGHLVDGVSEVEGLASKFDAGDVIFGKLRPYLAKATKLNFSGICSTEFIVMRAEDEVDPDFLAYLLRSSDFVNFIDSSTYGSKMPRANPSFIANCPVVIPPLPEQRAIAAFLDEKCAKVDEAVRIKEAQIALLRERRQILIQQAVTRGLNPAAPMKDSGIDWIGQIPAHWEVAKLKFLSNKIVDGTHFTPTYVEEGVPFLRVTDLTNMKDGQVDWENVRRIPEKEHRELSKRANAEYGDVLLSKNGTIGITRVVDWKNEFSFFVSLCLIKLRKELIPNYFVSFFGSPLVDEQLYFGSLRTSVTNLHLEKIKELLIVVPPRSEQEELVAQISIISKPIDDAIRIKEDQIAALKEYKTSLINAAVTGKIKVV